MRHSRTTQQLVPGAKKLPSTGSMGRDQSIDLSGRDIDLHQHMMSSISEGVHGAAQHAIKSLMQDCEHQIPNVDMRKLFSASGVTDDEEGKSGYLKPEQQKHLQGMDYEFNVVRNGIRNLLDRRR